MKILILRVSAIGDVIHTLPSIFLIKKIIPKAKISWIVQEKAASLLINQPFLEKIWVLPDKFLKQKNWSKTLQIIRDVKETEWDLILDFQGILKTSIIITQLRGLKIGFDKKNARSRITTYFTHKQIEPKYTNIIQKNMALVSGAIQKILNDYVVSPSLNKIQNDLKLNFDDEIKKTVDKWLNKNKCKKLLLLSPNTTWDSKHWPLENWKRLINSVAKEKKYSAALLGKDFGEQGKDLAKYINDKKLNISFVPKWDLLATGYLISQSDLLVAPDTGILHLGDCVNTKTIAIFGPTLARKHGPFLKNENIKNAIQINCPHRYQKRHGKKYRNYSSYKNCMYKLTPEMLCKKIDNVI